MCFHVDVKARKLPLRNATAGFFMCLGFFGRLFPEYYFVQQNVILWSNGTVGCKRSCSGSAGGKMLSGDNHKAR